MGLIIADYFYPLLHPFKHFEQLNRGERKSFALVDVVLMSSFFRIIHCGYVILALFLGHLTFAMIENNHPAMSLLFGLNSLVERGVFLTAIVGVIIFPFFSLGYYFLLKRFMIFSCGLFRAKSDSQDSVSSSQELEIEKSIHQIIVTSFSSNTFLGIPFFGDAIRHIYAAIILYAGLRTSLGLGRDQSLVILALPFIVFSAMIIGMLLYFYLLMTTVFLPQLSF
jgi:hypothetical protein